MEKKNIRKIIMVGIWLLLWQGLDMLFHSDLIMAGPLDTVMALGKLVVTWEFYRVIFMSLLRIVLGLLTAFICALLLSVLAYRYSLLREFLQPAVLCMKSVPVASFVIIALLWMGSANLAVLIVFLIAFPLLYTQLVTGYLGVDPKMLEVAKVYRYKVTRQIRSIYIPAIFDEWKNACRLAVGMSFKAGVAAEVIAQPVHSIGEKLHMAKLYFSTGELFAWTVVIVLLSAGVEWALVVLLDWGYKKLCKDKFYKPRSSSRWELLNGYDIGWKNRKRIIQIRGLHKAYGKRVIIDNLDIDIPFGAKVAVIGESGVGKTTFLRILAGLEDAEFDEMKNLTKMVSLAFQETRLIDHNAAVSNLVFSMPEWKGYDQDAFLAAEVLMEIFEMEELFIPAGKMSGGMRKRLEVARAVFADSRLVLLDEPFSGLDEENKKKMIKFLNEYYFGRTMFFAAHNLEDIKELDPDMVIYFKEEGVDFFAVNA